MDLRLRPILAVQAISETRSWAYHRVTATREFKAHILFTCLLKRLDYEHIANWQQRGCLPITQAGSCIFSKPLHGRILPHFVASG